MSAPLVSVIVPAYGVAHLVSEALASLQAQTIADWEAIVVDDGAPDDVAGAVAAFADDPRIGLLKTDNGGVAVARNRGVAAARAPLVAFLDGDDGYAPHYLERLAAAHARDPELGFVTCDALLFGDRKEGELFSRYTPQVPPVTLARVMTREITVLAGSMVRRAAFDAVGGFDRAFRHCEDFDFWLRLLAAGWRGDYVAAPLVRYRKRENSLSSDELAMLRAESDAYARLLPRIDGQPEAEIARARIATLTRQANWIDGETLILAGQPRAGFGDAGGLGQQRRV